MMRTFKLLAVVACGLFVASAAWAQTDTTAPADTASAKTVAELAKCLESTEPQACLDACRNLSKLGSGAQAAVPALVNALKDEDNVALQCAAALTLATIGEGAKDAVPVLTDALKSKNDKLRAYAAHALGEIGPAAREAAVPLIELIIDEDPAVRREARDAVRRIRPPQELVLAHMSNLLKAASPADAAAAVATLAELGEAAVPGLCKALEDDDACYWAALALGEIGEKAAAAVPVLGKLLTHKDPEVRMQALVALGEIGAPAKPLAGQIGKLLVDDEEGSVRYAAAYALGMIGESSAAVSESLGQSLSGQDEFLRVASAWALLRVTKGKTPLQRQAVKNILDGLESDNPDVRIAAARALVDTSVPEDVILPAFRVAMQGLQTDSPEKIMPIVEALATLGKRVVPGCIQSLENKRPLRFYALQVLIRVGPDAEPAVPALIETLDDSDPALRRESLFALGAIGEKAAPATEAIAAKLADSDSEVRHAACYALGKIGPAAQAALPALKKAFASDDEFLRVASVWAALKISPDDAQLQQAAVPHLAAALADPREHVRVEAAYMLGELGQVAKTATAALEKAQQTDHSEAVRDAAGFALEQLK